MPTETRTAYRRQSSGKNTEQIWLANGTPVNFGDTIESTPIASNSAAGSTSGKNAEGVQDTTNGGDGPGLMRIPDRRGEHLMDTIKKRFREWDPTLVLENKASVARDHLANERTFLSWLRTSLAFISIGIAVTQLFRLNTTRAGSEDKFGKPLGTTFIILGIMFLSFGVMRYFHSQHLMTTGYFPASRASVVIGTLLTLITLAGCLIIVLVADDGAPDGDKNS